MSGMERHPDMSERNSDGELSAFAAGSLWFGRPLSTLSREELYAVIRHLSREGQARTTPSAMRAQALGRVEMIRRGEL